MTLAAIIGSPVNPGPHRTPSSPAPALFATVRARRGPFRPVKKASSAAAPDVDAVVRADAAVLMASLAWRQPVTPLFRWEPVGADGAPNGHLRRRAGRSVGRLVPALGTRSAVHCRRPDRSATRRASTWSPAHKVPPDAMARTRCKNRPPDSPTGLLSGNWHAKMSRGI